MTQTVAISQKERRLNLFKFFSCQSSLFYDSFFVFIFIWNIDVIPEAGLQANQSESSFYINALRCIHNQHPVLNNLYVSGQKEWFLLTFVKDYVQCSMYMRHHIFFISILRNRNILSVNGYTVLHTHSQTKVVETKLSKFNRADINVVSVLCTMHSFYSGMHSVHFLLSSFTFKSNGRKIIQK